MLTKQRNGYYNTKMGGQFTYLVIILWTIQSNRREIVNGELKSQSVPLPIYAYIWLLFTPWWGIAQLPHLRVIVPGPLECASASCMTFRDARIPSLLFCAKCTCGDPLVGYLGRVSSEWHSQ